MSSRRVSGERLTGPMVQTMPERRILLAVEYMFSELVYSMLVLLARARSCPGATSHFSKMDCNKQKVIHTFQTLELSMNIRKVSLTVPRKGPYYGLLLDKSAYYYHFYNEDTT